MTNSEFSNEFDVLYNSITSNQAPGLDEYEKSVFLTKAQDETIKSYFDPRSNKVQEGFDGSQRRQIDFSNITKAETYSDASKLGSPALFDPRSNSIAVNMPSDILMMLNERLKVTREEKDTYLTVIPIQFGEYDRLMSKPYKRPLKNQAWRVFNYSANINKADLVVGPGDTITEYAFRYVRRPKAIILSDLTDEGVSLGGETKAQSCELDPILHHEILQRAVELAKAAYTGDLNSQLALGSASQTNIGVIPQSR